MASSSQNYHLERFIAAQQKTYDDATSQLRAGEKTSHWIWYIFPQMTGLGRTETANYYGITSLEEARAYLAHPLLGARLVECVRLVLAVEGRSLHDIFGSPDDMKFCSSMTLFGAAASGPTVFEEALTRYCGGEHDAATLRLLRTGAPSRNLSGTTPAAAPGTAAGVVSATLRRPPSTPTGS